MRLGILQRLLNGWLGLDNRFINLYRWLLYGSLVLLGKCEVHERETLKVRMRPGRWTQTWLSVLCIWGGRKQWVNHVLSLMLLLNAIISGPSCQVANHPVYNLLKAFELSSKLTENLGRVYI
ncbi:hypothetical protein Dsin_001089 [Dipteronia sinensis]|uniref:Uncharacterized protein n=1 Tax=Dipteronia sinensis TaxID=43782 RepID=A0AAE0EI19_9ROSI|nr:hypothetical protein Dsin_001089 [Dipteronia sinensis]